ncbi:hypothetical protein D3C85_710520 [compost metagenome]
MVATGASTGFGVRLSAAIDFSGCGGRVALPPSLNTSRRLTLPTPGALAASPPSIGATPPHPAITATYCEPLKLKVMGAATMPVWAAKDQSFLPLSAE